MEWVYEINKLPDCSEKCPEDILERQSPEELSQWISKFIPEARRTDGQKYTPRSIHQNNHLFMHIISLEFFIFGHSLKINNINILENQFLFHY